MLAMSGPEALAKRRAQGDDQRTAGTRDTSGRQASPNVRGNVRSRKQFTVMGKLSGITSFAIFSRNSPGFHYGELPKLLVFRYDMRRW